MRLNRQSGDHTLHFKYTRSTKDEYLSSRLWSGLMLFAFGCAFLYVYVQTASKSFLFVSTSIIAITSVFVWARLSKLKKSGGRWDICITETELIWSTPKGFENSFTVPLSEISKFVESSSGMSEYTTYYLLLNDGSRIDLIPSVSNFNFSSFARVLVRLGVKREYEIER
jgi:hypothetical protein